MSVSEHMADLVTALVDAAWDDGFDTGYEGDDGDPSERERTRPAAFDQRDALIKAIAALEADRDGLTMRVNDLTDRLLTATGMVTQTAVEAGAAALWESDLGESWAKGYGYHPGWGTTWAMLGPEDPLTADCRTAVRAVLTAVHQAARRQEAAA